jgi:para-nitrobenzyl esterase
MTRFSVALLLVLTMLLAACTRNARTPTPPRAPPTASAPADTPAKTLAPAPTASDAPRVKIASGAIKGVRENNLNAFKGIPYAAPPVGELRWREPQPVAAWSGVRPANAFGHACIQPAPLLQGETSVGTESEDCLYLNVWSPNTDASAKLPVMVWIHGGALVTGAGSLPFYDGTSLSSRGAVVVTINDRLGPLGFFAHPALAQEDPNGLVNFGLLDQIAALKWVQHNIAAFGGDANNVMIFGESAGAQSVLALFASPLARGLFAKGVAQRAYGIPSHTRAAAMQAGIQVATGAGLDGAQATLAQLRAIPADEFKTLNKKGMSLAPSFIFGDAALPEPILDIFQKGNEAPVPLILGSNSDEATVATAFGIDPAKLIANMGNAKIALKPLFPDAKDNDQLGRELIRDLIFTALAKRIADYHAVRAPSWRYYFTYVPQNLRDQEPGVPHGGEIVFVFGTGDRAPQYQDLFTDADRAMAQRVGDYWYAFARNSKPDAANEPAWVSSTPANDTVLEFGETLAPQTHFMHARLNVFVGLLNLVGKFLH